MKIFFLECIGITFFIGLACGPSISRERTPHFEETRGSIFLFSSIDLIDGGRSESGKPLFDAEPSSDTPCGKIPKEGCCLDEELFFCYQDQLTRISCENRPHCGWNELGFYDCDTSGMSDPQGQFAKSCELFLGDGGIPDQTPKSDVGASICQMIGQKGCCHGHVLVFCEGGTMRTLSCDLNPSCGWLSVGQVYDCGTEGKQDPLNTFPKDCPLGIFPEGAFTDLIDLGGLTNGDIKIDSRSSGDNRLESDQGCACQITKGGGEEMISFSVLLMGLICIMHVRNRYKTRGKS